MAAKIGLVVEGVSEELCSRLQAAAQRQSPKGGQQLAARRFLSADLRPDRVVHLDLHRLRPFDVWIDPRDVTVTGSPTATRDKRRAVAWSTGRTMTSSASPRLRRARACPSTLRMPANEMTLAHRS